MVITNYHNYPPSYLYCFHFDYIKHSILNVRPLPVSSSVSELVWFIGVFLPIGAAAFTLEYSQKN